MLQHLLVDLGILAIFVFFSGFCLRWVLLSVLSFPVLMEVYQSWRTSRAAILAGGVEWSVFTKCWMLSSWDHC